MPLKLIVANKAYSSWSLRPWILLAHFKIPFEEVVIPMDRPETRAEMLKYAPTGKCPSLHDGKIAVWESLAIIDYLAENNPEKAIWPKDKAARAHARSLAAEMHGGFSALRQACPANFRRKPKAIPLNDAVRADIARIEAAWAHARKLLAIRGLSCSEAFQPPTRCSRPSSAASTPTIFRSLRPRAPIWTRSWLCPPGRRGSATARPSPGGSRSTKPSEGPAP